MDDAAWAHQLGFRRLGCRLRLVQRSPAAGPHVPRRRRTGRGAWPAREDASRPHLPRACGAAAVHRGCRACRACAAGPQLPGEGARGVPRAALRLDAGGMRAASLEGAVHP